MKTQILKQQWQSVEHTNAARKVSGSKLGHSTLSLVKIKELVQVVNGYEEKVQRL